MDKFERLQLQQMCKANNVTDQTTLIRELKHSDILRKDVSHLLKLKGIYKNDVEMCHVKGISECPFLFTYYTDIYNKIRKDEIDVVILFQFLDVLKKIENDELDQHDGSFEVGTLLKKIYIDSALKKADKINATHTDTDTTVELNTGINISWSQFKKIK